MTEHLLGQIFALLAAVTWAFALVLFKRSGEQVPPIALNLFKNTVGLLLLIASVVVLGLRHPDSFNVLASLTYDEICLLMLSGIIGIALADTLFFYALNLIDVGLISVVDCAYSPFAILFAWILLAETLAPAHYIGATLIVAGVFLGTRHNLPTNRSRGQIFLGVLLAGVAVAMMAFGIVIAKPVLEEIDVMWAAALRMVAGAVLLGLYATLGRNWRRNWVVFKPARAWWYALPASIFGTYLAMVFWVAGFKYTYASVAAVLNQTSIIFASIFAVLLLHERFGLRKIIALTLALGGVIIITFSDWISPRLANLLTGLS